MDYHWRLCFGCACMVAAMGLGLYSVSNEPYVPGLIGSAALIIWAVYYALFRLRCQNCGFPVLMRSEAQGVRYGAYEQMFLDPCPHCGGKR